ncbi:MAG: hypothetical protein QOH21_1451 [Acidobacteriota bacterium]|nr:hypothetical protein [Acidobacteriota bacterium]
MTLRIIHGVPFTRLSDSAQTLYAELLDQMRVAAAEAAIGDTAGSFVSKEIRGNTYWYLQKSEGARKRQIYVGRDSAELRKRIEAANDQRLDAASDEKRRRELISMLTAAGLFRESAAITTVLQILGDAGVFRAGGVLVGTQAFSCTANLLGVRFDQQSLRTADVDVAHDDSIPLGLSASDASGGDVLARLRAAEPRFFAIPGLDVREPSTSFKVRGRDLRVDFLTPARSRQSPAPVLLPHLGVAAQPLAGLDYLLEEPIDAVVVAAAGVHVQVPSPARFALHKMWVASQRPASEQAKVQKDLRQAEQLLDVLSLDRPDDISVAYASLSRRGSMLRVVRRAWKGLPDELQERLHALI